MRTWQIQPCPEQDLSGVAFHFLPHAALDHRRPHCLFSGLILHDLLSSYRTQPDHADVHRSSPAMGYILLRTRAAQVQPLTGWKIPTSHCFSRNSFQVTAHDANLEARLATYATSRRSPGTFPRPFRVSAANLPEQRALQARDSTNVVALLYIGTR